MSTRATTAHYGPGVAVADEQAQASRAIHGPRGSRTLLFAAQADQARARRATDVFLLLSSALTLALLGAMAVPQPGVERAFESFVRSVPSGLDGLWRLLVLLPAVLSVFLLLAALYGRRSSTVRDLVLAGGVAFCLSLVVARIVVGSWPAVWDSLRSAGGTSYYPPLGLAVTGAAVLGISADLRRMLRIIARWSIILAFLGSVLQVTATPTGAVSALLAAVASASAVRLAFGSSMGRPSLADVAAALSELGVPAHSLGIAGRQAAGVFLVDAADSTGDPLVVKVYGRDAHDTQLLTTVWRKAWYRDPGAPTAFRRLSQAEHEAFLTLLAAQAGIHTHRVVTASATPQRDVLLVLRGAGTPLAEVPERWSEAVVANAWQTVRQLHRNGISHGQLDDAHVMLDGEAVGLVDFRGGAIAPTPEQKQTDWAQLLVTTALAVGVEPAIGAVTEALEPGQLAATLPYVQQPALTARQRRAVRTEKLDLDALRKGAAERAELPAPELQKIRRVSLRSVLQIVLLIVAFFALASGIGGLDFELLGDQIRHATWWLIIVGALLVQGTRLANAVSTTGASPTPLPLGPVYGLQLAMAYVALAVPATAARIAVAVRFFQRHGLRAGTALAIGALDSFAQFVLQVIILLGLLTLTSATLELDLDGAAPDKLNVLILVVLALVVAAAILLAVMHKWRRAIVTWVRRLITEALHAARGLRSPRRLTLLVGGNLASELIFAVALQLFVLGFGYHVGLGEILFINITVSLLAGIMPVPGGIGVVEGGLTYGLVRAGLPEETAFAAVLLYRLATFYLPPIWGFFALRWLERNKHL